MKRGIWLVLTFLFINLPGVLAKQEASIMDVILGATDESAVLLKFLYAALIYIIIYKTTKETVFKQTNDEKDQHRLGVMFSLIISLIVMRFTPDVILDNFGWVAGILGPILVVFFIMRGITGEKHKTDGTGKFPWKATIATIVICLLAFIALYAFDSFPGYVSGMPIVGYALDEFFSDIFYLSFFKFAPLLAIVLVGLLIWGIVALAKGSSKEGGGFTLPSGKWLLWALGIILGIALLLFLLSGGGPLLGWLALILSGIWAYGLYVLGGLLLLALVVGLLYLLYKHRDFFWKEVLSKIGWKWVFLVLLGILLGVLIFYGIGWMWPAIILGIIFLLVVLWKYRDWLWKEVLQKIPWKKIFYDANGDFRWWLLALIVGLPLLILVIYLLAISGILWPWGLIIFLVVLLIAGLIWLFTKYKGGGKVKDFLKKMFGDVLWDKLLKHRRLRYILALEDSIAESKGRSIVGWLASLGGRIPLDFFKLRPGTPVPNTKWTHMSGIAKMGRKSNRLAMTKGATSSLDVGVYTGVSKFMMVENATVTLRINGDANFIGTASSGAGGTGASLTKTITLKTGPYGIDSVLVQAENKDYMFEIQVVRVTADKKESAQPKVFEVIVGAGGAGPSGSLLHVDAIWHKTSNRRAVVDFFITDPATGAAVPGVAITVTDTFTPGPVRITGAGAPTNTITMVSDPSGHLNRSIRMDLNRWPSAIERHIIDVVVTPSGVYSALTGNFTIEFNTRGSPIGGPRSQPI
tara:strand:- start:2578 stop:4821 length:2244 start_codon:yes stop_codon:yes gene_type:complete